MKKYLVELWSGRVGTVVELWAKSEDGAKLSAMNIYGRQAVALQRDLVIGEARLKEGQPA